MMAQITPSPSSLGSAFGAAQKVVYVKSWLRLFQAVAEGKELQMEAQYYKGNLPDYREWYDIDIDYLIHRASQGLRFECIRIKPAPKKQSYRVGLFKNMIGNFVPCVLCDELAEQSFERSSGFIRWLTDRIEYELPEADHE